MLALLSVLACALYVVPPAALVALLRAEPDDALDLACALGVVFSADLLGTLALTHVFRVEAAAFVRTALLSAGALGVALRRRARGEPVLRARGGLGREDLVALGLGAGLAFAVSLYASSQYWMWDREWHVPFAASLRAQAMPFHNVYDPRSPLRYHLAGDVFAASLQSLSFAAMNASRALSLAHDLQAALAAGIVALLLRAVCKWPPATAAAAGLVPLLAGPLTLHASQTLGAFEGDADFGNFTLSFRPHCMVAGVVLVSLMSHVVRLARDRQLGRAPSWERPVLLALLLALLSITDEISSVLVGLSLGALWVFWPEVFGARRWRGALLIGAMAAAALLANLLLEGTLAPGGPIQQTSWVAPRLPLLAAPGRPLGLDPESWKIFLSDEGSMIAPLLVVAGLLAARRDVRDAALLPALFASLLAAGGLVLFLCFEANGRTYEGHRFVTAGRFLVPIVALICAAKLPRAAFPSILLLAPVLGGVFASVGFVTFRLPHKGAEDKEGQYDTNCRREVGARLGEPMVPTFVDEPIWYRYAGCRPIFAAGHDGPPGVVLAGFPKLGPGGFAKMDRGYFPPGAAARVVCAADPKLTTLLCRKAKALGACESVGELAVACAIPPAARAAMAVP